jgi:hypothetical protein
MSLDEQDVAADQIASLFPDAAVIHDLRATPHSGYRGVHIWLRLPARAEIQIRTHLQGHWANMYEAAADAWGRAIRYDAIPTDPGMAEVVVAMRTLSTTRIAGIEDLRNRAERLRRDNSRRLNDLHLYDVDDTLPAPIGEALEIQATIDELLLTAKREEAEVQSIMLRAKRIFETPA